MPANIYKLKDGTIVPGTTTICNILGKGDGITNWAHKIAYTSTIDLIKKAFNEPRFVGELTIPDYNEIKKWQTELKEAGDIGTLVHEAVLHFFTGETIDLSNEVVSKCFGKFLHWWNEEIARWGEPTVIVEQPIVSEKLGFGGQPDLHFVEWERTTDVKTSNGIYESHWLQLAGYGLLRGAKEHQILWLPKDSRFGCPIRTDLRKEKKIFKKLLEIYQLRREE